MKPLFLINFKAYAESAGEQGLQLTKLCERVSRSMKVDIAVAPQQSDMRFMAKLSPLKVFAQHVDPIEEGAFTGQVTAFAAHDSGCFGVMINHSERPVTIDHGAKIIALCKARSLVTVYCAPTPLMVDRIRKYEPDYIAIEPPELIGGKISVSTAKPQVITESIARAKGIPVLCGAGIHTKADVEKAMELGAAGILVASGVVKAGKDQEKVIIQLAEGLRKKP